MEAMNGWAEVTPYIEELRFGQYKCNRREPVLINLAFVRQIRPTTKKTQDGVPLVEVYDGSYPSVMIEKQEADALREYILDVREYRAERSLK